MRLRLLALPLLLAAVLPTAAPAGAAPPNGGGPGCGGHWVGSAQCFFVTVAPLPIFYGGFAVADDLATITVNVRLGGPFGPIAGSCTAAGPRFASCTGQIQNAAPGLYWCEVHGVREGLYGCVQDP